MLSYQHEYHAGNHADVLKHVCLSAILSSLCRKEKPFTVIDSHAGAGRFSLHDERLLRTGEASGGIGRLLSHAEHNPIPPCIERYLDLERPYTERGLYAGSPELTRLFLRKGDTHFAVELHPQASKALSSSCGAMLLTKDGEREAAAKTHVRVQDGFSALSSLVPPLVKRGLVLTDPSFEDASDYRNAAGALRNVRHKWGTAVIALWYPLVSRRRNEREEMLSELERAAKTGTQPVDCMRAELSVADPELFAKDDGPHLYGSGMFVINPPWKLKEEMDDAVAFLSDVLAEEKTPRETEGGTPFAY